MDKKTMTLLVLLYNDQARDKIWTVQRKETKQNEKGFFGFSCDCPWAYLKDTPILKKDNYFLPTS